MDYVEIRLNDSSYFLTCRAQLIYVSSVLSMLPTFHIGSLKIHKRGDPSMDRPRCHCLWDKQKCDIDQANDEGGLGIIDLEP